MDLREEMRRSTKAKGNSSMITPAGLHVNLRPCCIQRKPHDLHQLLLNVACAQPIRLGVVLGLCARTNGHVNSDLLELAG